MAVSRCTKNDLRRGYPASWAGAVVIIERFLKGRMMSPRNEGGIGFRGEDSERVQTQSDPHIQHLPCLIPDY